MTMHRNDFFQTKNYITWHVLGIPKKESLLTRSVTIKKTSVAFFNMAMLTDTTVNSTHIINSEHWTERQSNSTQ